VVLFLSIVVPIRNEAQHIHRTLTQLLAFDAGLIALPRGGQRAKIRVWVDCQRDGALR
jgi:hypothetical protein